jgi:uncharacterized membrane protein
MHMNASIAPSPWPAPPSSGRQPWHFGREWESVEGRGVQWQLRRNCSLTPRQLLSVYLSLCAVSLGIATMFWLQGAPVVMMFAGTELLVVGIALLVYARHATDSETITLSGDSMRVEHRCGPRVEQAEFRAAWLRVEPLRGQGSLVQLSGDGQQVCVGRYVRPELRSPLAGELRRAVRMAWGVSREGTDSRIDVK